MKEEHISSTLFPGIVITEEEKAQYFEAICSSIFFMAEFCRGPKTMLDGYVFPAKRSQPDLRNAAWVNQQEAATVLGAPQLETLRAKGRITYRCWQTPTGATVTEYLLADIEARLKPKSGHQKHTGT